MNTLMEELKILQQETQEWKKPTAGEPCNHMHVECWDGKFMCSGCSPPQEITDPQRIQREKEIQKKLGDEDRSEPEQSVERGVTIAFLVALCKTFNLYKVTTGEVLRNFVIPLTSGSRCRFVELEAMRKAGVVGQAVTFISHCNKAFFGDLVAGLCDGGADLTRRVWVDIFTVRQWPSSKSDLHFEVVIRQCSAFMVVCPSIQEVTHMSDADIYGRRFPPIAKARVPFFRIWCLYEIYYAAIEGKPIVMKGGSCCLEELSEGRQAIRFNSDRVMLIYMYYAIEVEQAEATVASDKAFIFKKILSYKEGVAGFNSRVRGVLAGAVEACDHPDLHCAVCGDATAVAALRKRANDFIPIAAAGGFQAVLKDLLHKNSGLIHTSRSQSGMTAIMLAAVGGHFTCLEWLLEYDADVNAVRPDGWTAIMLAAVGGHLTCLEWLGGKGANIHAIGLDGKTALMLAAQGGHLTCLQWLATRDANTNLEDQDGITALILAAVGGHLTCLQWLIEYHADVNKVKRDGRTALMVAAAA
eukprot:gene25430-biopygen16455